jgi:uncharacterized MAPEG superfamily protein
LAPELSALAAAVLVQFAALTAYSVVGNRQLGPRVTLSPRDHLPPLSPLLGRLQRAHANGIEALATFTPAVLVVVLADAGSGFTAACAWTHVVARALYIPAYGLGLVPWRSLIWTVGMGATALMLVSAFLTP